MKRLQLILLTILIALGLWYLLGGRAEPHRKDSLLDVPGESSTDTVANSDESAMTSSPPGSSINSIQTTDASATPSPNDQANSATSSLRKLSDKEVDERRSSVKSSLNALYTAQAAYFAEYDRYSSDLGHLGYLPAEGTLKAKFGFLEPYTPKGGINPNEDPTRASSDAFTALRDDDGDPVYQYDEYSRGALLAKYDRYCTDRCSVRDDGFELISAFNLDNDETLDVWIIDHRKNLRHVVDDLVQ